MALQTESKPLAPPPARQGPPIERWVIGLFLASGAAGLMYQVIWSRELVLVFGNTTQAISTIVTAVMAGLGLGGFVGGRLVRRSRNPLALYGLCELGVAAFALLLPAGFGLIGDVYRAAYGALTVPELTAVRAGLALAAVTPATFLMGVTLPLLTRVMVRHPGHAGARLAELYAANTLGAVLGTLIAGFALIELLGLIGTSYVAVLLNVLAGLGALGLARRQSPAGLPPSEDGAPDVAVRVARESAPRKLIFFATCISGFVALALEVLWTRMLAEGSGSRIYVFVIILAIYLFGIAAGSAIYRGRSGAAPGTLGTLGVCFAGVGLAAIATVILGSGVLGGLPGAATYGVLLLATLLMGYAFPVAGRLAMRTVGEAGQSVGLLYAWNTAGSIVGAFAAAFLFAPTIGTNSAILTLAAVSLVLGAGLALRDREGAGGRPRALAAGMALIALLSLAASLARLPLTRTATENRLRQEGRLVAHLEDSLATVDSAGGAPADRRLYVAGVGMTALTIDTKLMAYLPKTLRPGATRFLDIAFGMGSTYRSGLILGLTTDAVELSPSVPSQMPAFYADAPQFLQHPRGRIIIADGRNYVRLSSEQYDLIAVDPPPPIQSAGTVVLYTQEFLAQGKARLTPGGVFMLWIPYDEPLADFKDHLRTFRAAFQHMRVMFGPGHNGAYMLGSDGPLEFDPATIRQVFGTPAAQADLAGAPDFPATGAAEWPAVIAQNLWLADAQVDAFAGPGPLITDNTPRTEYYLLRTLLSPDSTPINEDRLRAAGGAPGR